MIWQGSLFDSSVVVACRGWSVVKEEAAIWIVLWVARIVVVAAV